MQMHSFLLKNPYDTYKMQGVMTAGPMQLIVMLYNGLKKNLSLAQRAMEQKNGAETAHKHMIKAQNIVDELLNSLDMSFSLSKDLMVIYEYLLHALAEINATKNPAAIGPLLEIIEDLRDAWQQAGEMQKGQIYVSEGQ
ncbi:MAG: flagellar export chaperone FliS [Clostridiales bacterium]|nr:flagellar export chaperone FliS [Clostridiales bacterium]